MFYYDFIILAQWDPVAINDMQKKIRVIYIMKVKGKLVKTWVDVKFQTCLYNWLSIN